MKILFDFAKKHNITEEAVENFIQEEKNSIKTLAQLLTAPQEFLVYADWVCGFGRSAVTLFVIQNFYYNSHYVGYVTSAAIVDKIQENLEEKEMDKDILNLTREELLDLYKTTSCREYDVAAALIKDRVGLITLSGLGD